MMKLSISETEKILKNIGDLEDFSDMIMEENQDKIIKVYDLCENKYNDVTDDSITIELHSDDTFVITNEDLSYDCDSEEDTQLLQELFRNSSYQLEINSIRESPYKATVSVSAKITELTKLRETILEYRKINDQFLSDKVKEIIGDNGMMYLDRI